MMDQHTWSTNKRVANNSVASSRERMGGKETLKSSLATFLYDYQGQSSNNRWLDNKRAIIDQKNTTDCPEEDAESTSSCSFEIFWNKKAFAGGVPKLTAWISSLTITYMRTLIQGGLPTSSGINSLHLHPWCRYIKRGISHLHNVPKLNQLCRASCWMILIQK